MLKLILSRAYGSQILHKGRRHFRNLGSSSGAALVVVEPILAINFILLHSRPWLIGTHGMGKNEEVCAHRNRRMEIRKAPRWLGLVFRCGVVWSVLEVPVVGL
jgi:hypothetical protein